MQAAFAGSETVRHNKSCQAGIGGLFSEERGCKGGRWHGLQHVQSSTGAEDRVGVVRTRRLCRWLAGALFIVLLCLEACLVFFMEVTNLGGRILSCYVVDVSVRPRST